LTLKSSGQSITGSVSSVTVTWKLQLAVLPAASLTVQLTVDVPTGKVEPEAGVQTGEPTPGQLSLTVGGGYVTTPVHIGPPPGTGSGFGGQVMVGAVLSTTVTVNEQVASLPAASRTVQVTVVIPSENEEPEGGTQLGAPTPGQLSLTVGSAQVTVAEHIPLAEAGAGAGGQVIVGSCASFTVTSKQQVAWLPDESVAVQQTSVVPTGKNDPEAGVQTTVGLGSQVSMAVAVKVSTAPH
jgi:hypothetical protein